MRHALWSRGQHLRLAKKVLSSLHSWAAIIVALTAFDAAVPTYSFGARAFQVLVLAIVAWALRSFRLGSEIAPRRVRRPRRARRPRRRRHSDSNRQYFSLVAHTEEVESCKAGWLEGWRDRQEPYPKFLTGKTFPAAQRGGLQFVDATKYAMGDLFAKY
jgi:hypothetical protein